LGLYLSDQIVAGLTTTLTGRPTDTLFVQNLTNAGLTREQAMLVDMAMGMALTGAVLKAANTPAAVKATGAQDSPKFTPSLDTKVVNKPEIKAPNAIKSSDVLTQWDDFLGPNQTNIHPRTGQVDPNRIFSADGTKSIRLSDHEMNSIGTPKSHYHLETWVYDPVSDTMTVTNVLQRIKY
jgi:hypothetical protein